jgi:Protein of unknown function (DUF4239)
MDAPIYADVWTVALVLATAMLVAWRIGRTLGAQMRETGGAQKYSKFDDAGLALLGLLLAFTFSFAANKHDQRRMMVVADSNAIGDFYTCASLLKEPTRSKLQAVIRQYAIARLDLTQHPIDEATLGAALRNFDSLHGQMAELVREAINDGTPIAVSLTNTLNAVTSNQASRLAAFQDRLPGAIALLLIATAVGTSFLVGREQGADGYRDVSGTLIFILLVTFTVFVTLDLNDPQHGWLKVSQVPMQRLVDSMKSQ